MLDSPQTTTFSDWPVFDEEMVEAASRVLRSGKVNYGQGIEGRSFEAELTRLLKVPYAVAVTNGTAALELALRALGIGPGDDVVTTPRSFIASASSIVACGARPVFADVSRDSGTLLPKTIETALTPNTAAIVVVHLGGWPCDLDPILELARRYGIRVVEDVAQAFGGTYKGRALGSQGHVGAFSFCQDKILTTAGEGGLLTTNDEEIFKRAWGLREHGKNWEASQNLEGPPGYKWVRHQFGANYRMTEVQAAVGRVGLQRLPTWLAIRQRNAGILAQRLRNTSALRVPESPSGHAHYLLYAYVRCEQLKQGWTRDRILSELLNQGVPCSVGSCSELYLEKAFDRGGFRPAARLPVAQELGETSLAFQVHPMLTENNMHQIGDAVQRIFSEAMF
jgi:dTDP-4-amino-4,6-dideoxygalactose transaminase